MVLAKLVLQVEVPSGTWQKVEVYFFYLLGKCYLLITDYFTNFPFVFLVKSITGREIRKGFAEDFTVDGIPKELYRDNGQPFFIAEFTQFAQMGI